MSGRLLERIYVHGEFLCDSLNSVMCQELSAAGGDRRVALLLCVKCVVELILHNFSVGSHRRFSVTVKIPVEEHRKTGKACS